MADASVQRAPAIAAVLRRLAPGVLLSAVVAVAAVAGAPWVARVAPIPAMVLALLIGIALNRLAARPAFTPAMLVYPLLSTALGFDEHLTGVLLGATIHDVAQVVGAGYAVSETAGNTAVIVKLFRVFLLLPVVLAIGWWFARKTAATTASNVPVPVFGFVFLALCLVNSILPSIAAIAPLYAMVKSVF